MFRVIFLTARLPYPLNDGWKIRTFHLIKGWKNSGAKIDLLSFAHGDEKVCKESMSELYTLCENVKIVKRFKSYNWIDLIKGLFYSTPFTVHNYRNPLMFKIANDMISEGSYNIIQIEDIVMAQYLPNFSRSIHILDMHNVESYLLERYSRNEQNLFKSAYAYLTALKLRNYEKKICRLFDKVMVCSREDKNLLYNYGVRVPVEVLPNGVNCSRFHSTPLVEDVKDDIVFVGSMDYHANISGVLYFVKNILPLIWKDIPGVRLFVVGKNPAKAILALANEQVIVTGSVSNIEPYLAKARVVVVPLLVGGGTRLKILEAMAACKPIVSTTIGAEGILANHGEHLVLADEPATFAGSVVELLNNPDKCIEMGKAARDLVESNYDWQVLTAHLRNSSRKC